MTRRLFCRQLPRTTLNDALIASTVLVVEEELGSILDSTYSISNRI